MTNSIISPSPNRECAVRNIHLYAAVLVILAQHIRPDLNELQHLGANVLVRGVLNQLLVRLAVELIADLFVNRRAAVLHHRLEHHQGIESRVRVG